MKFVCLAVIFLLLVSESSPRKYRRKGYARRRYRSYQPRDYKTYKSYDYHPREYKTYKSYDYNYKPYTSYDYPDYTDSSPAVSRGLNLNGLGGLNLNKIAL